MPGDDLNSLITENDFMITGNHYFNDKNILRKTRIATYSKRSYAMGTMLKYISDHPEENYAHYFGILVDICASLDMSINGWNSDQVKSIFTRMFRDKNVHRREDDEKQF